MYLYRTTMSGLHNPDGAADTFAGVNMVTMNVESELPRSETNTPASTIKADFAMLESNTPVVCSHQHSKRHDKNNLPPALPMPKIIGPAAPPSVNVQAKRTSFIAMLGGSSDRGLPRPRDNSRRGRSRFQNGVQYPRSSFLPNNSALSTGFPPSLPATSAMSRPSRQLNKVGLYELKEHLWKASVSSTDSFNLTVDSSQHYGNQCHPEHLLYFTHAFETSQTTVKNFGSVHDELRCSTIYMPLPRESVATMIDAVRVSALEDDEKCRFCLKCLTWSTGAYYRKRA
ncbi:unnamed protein product [Phytophthora fragariaefolia]|uniref:Unnamed protein product n=1 Tax=Phytophthora fragariaefolia TaxID=1490495 RepID=A0A9W6YLU5_9STRA|nr:unnamed protein product [Phytophthora fragariaefolia]